MFKNFLKKVEVISPVDPYAKLSNDIKLNMIKSIAITAVDTVTLLANPIITHNAIEKTNDDYGKSAIKVASAIIMVYQVERIITDIKKTNTTMNAYKASLKMIDPEFTEPISGESTIELSPSDWKIQSDETIDEFDYASMENSEEDESETFEYIIHVGEDIPDEEDYI